MSAQGNRPVFNASSFNPHSDIDVQIANLVIADRISKATDARLHFLTAVEEKGDTKLAFRELCAAQDELLLVLEQLSTVGHIQFAPFAYPNETIQ